MNSTNTVNESFRYNEEFKDHHTPWAGHKLFARELIGQMKPRTIVELGTYKGTSFLSFCEGDLAYKNKAKLYAIDTWEEDSYSGKYNGNSVKQNLEKLLEKYYPEVNYELIQSTFDDAVHSFKDLSIDLLHIDGWHTYEAVYNDYTKWRNKVSKNGLILFHDIKVVGGNFGVKQFWQEIIREFPDQYLEFSHSNGLGLLFNSKEKYKIDEFFNEKKLVYLERHYETIKSELYLALAQSKELSEIKSSKYWKIKEKIKSIIRR